MISSKTAGAVPVVLLALMVCYAHNVLMLVFVGALNVLVLRVELAAAIAIVKRLWVEDIADASPVGLRVSDTYSESATGHAGR